MISYRSTIQTLFLKKSTKINVFYTIFPKTTTVLTRHLHHNYPKTDCEQAFCGFESTFPEFSFVNMENMLELMDEPIEVKDIPNALPLMAMKGKIDFRNVSFHYGEDREILRNLNFTINPGQTFAIVSIHFFFFNQILPKNPPFKYLLK